MTAVSHYVYPFCVLIGKILSMGGRSFPGPVGGTKGTNSYDGSIDLHVCFGLEYRNISNSNDRPLFTEIVSLLTKILLLLV